MGHIRDVKPDLRKALITKFASSSLKSLATNSAMASRHAKRSKTNVLSAEKFESRRAIVLTRLGFHQRRNGVTNNKTSTKTKMYESRSPNLMTYCASDYYSDKRRPRRTPHNMGKPKDHTLLKFKNTGPGIKSRSRKPSKTNKRNGKSLSLKKKKNNGLPSPNVAETFKI